MPRKKGIGNQAEAIEDHQPAAGNAKVQPAICPEHGPVTITVMAGIPNWVWCQTGGHAIAASAVGACVDRN